MDSHTFKHTRLPKGDFIRILDLKNGDLESPLEFSFHLAHLRDHPPYEALSYTWGPLGDSATVLFQGIKISIPSNLRDALLMLRKPTSNRIVWADSLCIDQNDNEEKNHQVALMGRIYQQASQVIVWLGTDLRGIASMAFDLARQLARHEYPLLPRKSANIKPRHEVKNDLEWFGLVVHARPDHINDLEPADIDRWNALAEIYRRPWFTRIWVIQEVGMASSVIVMCGTATITWRDLVDAAGCIDDRAAPFALHFDMTAGVQQCFDIYWIFSEDGCEKSFAETLIDGKSFGSTETKDKVYALLSHPSARTGAGQAILEPKYNDPLAKLYTDLTTKLLRSTRSLQVLSAVQHRSVETLEQADIPSWVPRWAEEPWSFMMGATIRCRTYRAGLETEPEYDLVFDDVALKVRGILFDQVSDCCSIISATAYRSQESGHTNPVDTIERLLKDNEKATRERYPTNEQWLQAQYMTLTAGMFMGDQEDFARYQKWNAAEQRSGQSPTEGNAGLFATTAGLWSVKRRLFLTAKGHVGLGPSVMREQDLVCILFGCMVPFILRKQGSRYRFVGECYVHGIMKGEAIQSWSKGDVAQQEFTLF